MSTFKRIMLGFAAFTLLLGASVATISELTAQKVNAQEEVGLTDFDKYWIGHGNYAAQVRACRKTVNTPYGPMYQVHASATGARDESGNYINLIVWRNGREVASARSNAWFSLWGGPTMVATSGYVSMNNGDAISLEMGLPGSSSGTGRFLPYYLKVCPF